MSVAKPVIELREATLPLQADDTTSQLKLDQLDLAEEIGRLWQS
ncbi:MAG: hypothetical protein AAGB04_08280 [Pseudomonadota bacterium]